MADDFASDGALAKRITGFKPREAQREMAQAVTEAVQSSGELVVEAGTGTGKTYAYLAPALRANKKVIVSTGSKALQDQLYARDLPTIANALKFTGKTALLKGRSNYLCLERMEQQSATGGDLSVQSLTDLVTLRAWASHTVDGDISTCADVTEDSPIWPLVTSTNDNCLGSDCPQYKACFVVKARKKAMDADVVVVNHHLFLADLVVKEGGFGELIPEADVMIFDEAHQLPDIASQYFGQQISSRQLADLAKDIIIAYRTEVRDVQQLQKSADRLAQCAQDFRLALGEPGYRGNLRDLLSDNTIMRMFTLLDDALELCYDVIKLSLGRSALLDAAFERAALYRTRLKRIRSISEPGFSYWYECTSRHFVLALTPLSVAERFREMMDDRKAAWIFTSATLAVDEKMDHFADRLGVSKAKSLILSSPFDYSQQALLCGPAVIHSPVRVGSPVAPTMARRAIPNPRVNGLRRCNNLARQMPALIATNVNDHKLIGGLANFALLRTLDRTEHRNELIFDIRRIDEAGNVGIDATHRAGAQHGTRALIQRLRRYLQPGFAVTVEHVNHLAAKARFLTDIDGRIFHHPQ